MKICEKRKQNLTQEMLKENLHYDKKTGDFRWVKAKSGRMMKYSAGSLNSVNNRVIFFNGLAFTASRLAFLYVNGSFPEGVVRHKNGKNIDNRWKNLEEIDIKDVLKSRCLDRRNTSGYTGVYFIKDSDKIRASITVEGKRIELGVFESLKTAVKARKNAERQYGCRTNEKQEK